MDKIFEFTFGDIVQIIESAIILYIFIIFYIRILGKRSTSQLNNFDWIVTVSVGSLVASTVILKDVSIIEGIISILVLLLLQFLLTKFTYRSKKIKKIIKTKPQLLLFNGEFIDENMKNERILEAEVYAAIRQHGLKSVRQIYAIVLETNSKISVIPNENSDELGFSLMDVEGLPDNLKDSLENSDDRPASKIIQY